jgi:hypothetical protein
MSDIIAKIEEGLKRAYQKMIAEKALRDEEVVFSDGKGNPILVKARSLFSEEELKRILNLK